MLHPVGKARVAEEIVEQLRGLILNGEYAVGDKLPPERQLAVELGVNRASLREALKTLEHLGLVKTRQGDGTRVLDFMQTAGVELISHLAALEGAPEPALLREVLEFRRWFGKECARLAAERAQPEDLERLEALLVQSEQLAEDSVALLRLDFEFYVLLAQAAHNRVMQLLINTIRKAVSSYAPLFARLNPPPAEVRRQQRELCAALRDHDPARAATIADRYLSHPLAPPPRSRKA